MVTIEQDGVLQPSAAARALAQEFSAAGVTSKDLADYVDAVCADWAESVNSDGLEWQLDLLLDERCGGTADALREQFLPRTSLR